jgi:CRISPR-associated protein Cmr2
MRSLQIIRINLVDLPAFFGEGERSRRMREWLRNNGFADLITALIPELIIYSTGGSILAFCPAGLVDKLANAIEKRYTDEPGFLTNSEKNGVKNC